MRQHLSKGFTKAALASGLLLISGSTYAVDNNISTDTTLAITLEGSTNDTLTIKAQGGSLTTSGSVAVNSNLATTFVGLGNPTNTITVENSVTTQNADISSNLQAIVIKNTNANNKTLTTNISLQSGSIVQSTGTFPTIEDQSAINASASKIIFNNFGTLRNQFGGQAFLISGANTPTVIEQFNNENTGQIIADAQAPSPGSVSAIAVDLDKVGSLTNGLMNAGTIYSRDNSAIKSTVKVTNITIMPGTGNSTIQGKGNVNPVIDLGTTASFIKLTGGKVLAEANTSTAMKTSGAITISGGEITGKITGDPLATTVVFDISSATPFKTNGRIENVLSVGINKGVVEVNEDISAPVTVLATGTIGANKNVSLTKLTANGAKANIDLTSASVFGQLRVGAGSDITNLAMNVSIQGNGYIPNQTTFRVIDSAGNNLTNFGVTATFPTSAVYGFSFANNAQDVSVTVSRTPLSSLAVGHLQGLVGDLGATLEKLGANNLASGALLQALGEVQRMRTAFETVNGLRQLVPTGNQMDLQASLTNTSKALDVVLNRLTQKMTGFNSGDIYPFMSEQSLWGEVFTGKGVQTQRNDIFGYNLNTKGVSFGSDALLESSVRLGLAGTYSSTDTSTRTQIRNENAQKALQMTLYGAADFGCGWMDGALSFAKLRHKGLRKIRIGALSLDAKNIHRGREYMARLGYGHQYDGDNGVRVIPHLGFNWSHISQRTYTERDAGALNLVVYGKSIDVLDTTLSVKYNYLTKWNQYTIMPEWSFGLTYDVINKRDKTEVRFASAPLKFTVLGLESSRVAVDMGAGLNVLSYKDLNVRAHVDAQLKRSYHSIIGGLQVRYQM